MANVELFELTFEEKSKIEQSFQTVVAEAAFAQQEYEEAAEPLEREAQEKKKKIWAEFEAATALRQRETEPSVRHSQSVKPLEDKIRSVAESFNVQIRTLMESIDFNLPAPLYCGLNGEGVHYNEPQEWHLGAMVGPVEIAQYNIECRLVPRMSEADWAAQKALDKPFRELSYKRESAEHEVDCRLGEALRPFRQILDAKLEAAKSKYDKTVQDLVRVAMLRAGLDVADIRLDRSIGRDDDD